MKASLLTLLVAAAALLGTAVAKESSQAEPAGGDLPPGMTEEMMAAWAEIAAPGSQHALFKDALGSWKTTSKYWMDPEAPPSSAAGTAEFRLLLGGRYLMQEFHGEFGGQPYEGIGIEAYDKHRKQYRSIWFDSMSTGVAIMNGTCNEDGSRCTYFGEMDDFLTGAIGHTYKATAHKPDKDTMVFEMFFLKGPDWARGMEIVYRRAK